MPGPVGSFPQIPPPVPSPIPGNLKPPNGEPPDDEELGDGGVGV
jgi:hypothetical protein